MKTLLVFGPTGSGKSQLALALAERVGGVIINADASQAYRDLRILSARPSAADHARARHLLYGFVDPSERFSAGRWLERARAELEAARARGQQAIVVGGTGLYFKALTGGLAEAPPIPRQIREGLLAELEKHGPAALHARLHAEDAARIRPSDPARILRALEVQAVTGAPLSALHQGASSAALDDWAGLALTPDRERLYRTLDARFDAMMAAGALEEARALMDRRLDPDLPAMKALGLRPLIAHLRGEVSRERAIELAKRDTRRYAKRQFTWIAGQMKGWTRVDSEDPVGRLNAAVLGNGVDAPLSAK